MQTITWKDNISRWQDTEDCDRTLHMKGIVVFLC